MEAWRLCFFISCLSVVTLGQTPASLCTGLPLTRGESVSTPLTPFKADSGDEAVVTVLQSLKSPQEQQKLSGQLSDSHGTQIPLRQ